MRRIGGKGLYKWEPVRSLIVFWTVDRRGRGGGTSEHLAPGRSSRFKTARGIARGSEQLIAAAQLGRLTWMRASSRESLKRSVKDWSVKKVGKDRPLGRYEATLMGITFSSSVVVALFSLFSRPGSTQLCSLLFPPTPRSFFVSSVVSLRTSD